MTLSKSFAEVRAGKRSGFIPFVVAGDPDLSVTGDLLHELSALRPAAIEVGVPFSDPTADGPVIQRAAQRALERGTNLSQIFEMLTRIKERTAPLVLFSYYNPLLQFGLEKFARAAMRAGVSGVLVVDLPVESARPLHVQLRRKKIDLIFLVTPTTAEDRLRQIARLASGFIYVVARTGVTGTARDLSDESRKVVARVREVSTLPVAVGFGVTTGAQAKRIVRYADAAVVGSRLVAEIEASAKSSRKGLVKRFAKCARDFSAATTK